MGVNFQNIIISREISISELSNKKIAVDAYNWIYQFLSIIRQRDGTLLTDNKGKTTSHLAGLFYRSINLLKNNIKPCFVFDGKPPKFKAGTLSQRYERKEKAKIEYDKALEEKDYEKARSYAQQTSMLSDEMIEESKALLKALGIPCLQAPSEGEAQASYMAKNKDVFAAASQDWDSLLFGVPYLIRNLSVTGRRKLPKRQVYVSVLPEIIDLNKVLSNLGINREQLIILGLLVGTDYNPGGIKGIGPKKALKIVKEQKTLKQVLKQINWNFKILPEDLIEFFLNPKVEKKYDLAWDQIDKEQVKKILVDQHDFSEERINNAVNEVIKESKSGTQSCLGKYF